MEAQGGEQADHAVRDPLRDLGQRMLSGVGVVAGGIEAARVTRDVSLAEELVHPLARNAALFEVRWPYDSQLPDDLERSAFNRSRHGQPRIQNVGSCSQLPTFWAAPLGLGRLLRARHLGQHLLILVSLERFANQIRDASRKLAI